MIEQTGICTLIFVSIGWQFEDIGKRERVWNGIFPLNAFETDRSNVSYTSLITLKNKKWIQAIRGVKLKLKLKLICKVLG